MAVPEGLTLRHHRDLEGREKRPFLRHFLLALLALFLLAGLLNAFGQVEAVSQGEAAAARFEVSAPERMRGGLYFEARYEIEAIDEIENATVVLDPGWLDGVTLNTVEPAPVGEASRDGKVALELGRVPAGRRYVLFLHFQVNPTEIGQRSQDVELYDGEELLVSIDRDAVIWP